MHDPMTVAFEIRRPWPERFPRGPFKTSPLYWPSVVTIWHCDPEADGSDDSCDWFNRRKKRLRIHPKLHVWHWRIQVHAILYLKRWLFSRCCECGKRFAWGYAPVSHTWGGGGPRWFRPEPKVFHLECDTAKKPFPAPSSPEGEKP